MNTRRRAKITQDNIDNGAIGRPQFCPVALGCEDILTNVRVYQEQTFADSYGHICQVCYQHGPLLTTWINKYDDGDNVDPITVEFDDDTMTAEIVP